MEAELAQRLSRALSSIDSAKTELAFACSTGNTESQEAAGDRYLEARDEMADTMKAIGEAKKK